ncbi:D-glycerate dehydrogenase [Bdellovibrio bacteriovorus]|uniref:D-glycerate dehydrogenase n=1 Tax=Bdellovibrio bacteriovorus TaxID=959 RepID=A0A162GYD5_BDEBC|nr:D-glycerate dehydrogenase [Bdellovibrio bacteriovorus]KYG69226.1 D-glycerate dehydrogenase [Bdellovibrio bacteriovorus]
MNQSDLPTVFFTFPTTTEVLQQASKKFDVISTELDLTPKEILLNLESRPANAIVVGSKQKCDADFIKQLPSQVQIIATSSVGFEHIDVEAAKKRRLQASNTPDVLTDCTADLTLLLLLGASRRAREYVHVIEKGWTKPMAQNELLGVKLSGRTLGILGMGRIGQAVAQRARAFGLKILYHNRKRLSTELENGATYFKTFEEMLPHCDIVSLHAPATNETKNIINEKTLQIMKAQSILVNVARGSLVDETALLKALDSGKIFAAGLDVFQNEPSPNNQLVTHERVFPTPHMASATIETRTDMGLRALENVERVLMGQAPRDPLWT